MTILVTGATGLVGGNVVEQLLAQGKTVRTMVRNPAAQDAEDLRKAGVEVVAGELASFDDVKAAAKGATGIIHSAAMLGGPGASMEEGFYANALGTIHIYSAAAIEGGIPTVHVITNTYFDQSSTPNEKTPMDQLFKHHDAYTATKRLGYAEGVVRAMEGQDIRFMQPGAVYGPAICTEKALRNDNFNGRFGSAIRAEVTDVVPMTAGFAFAADCAEVCIAALERGRRGERYMALGRIEETMSLADAMNLACEMAGVAHRVRQIPPEDYDKPEIVARFGKTLTHLAKTKKPDPLFDSSFTEKTLGVTPTSLKAGLPRTIEWMRQHGAI